MGDYNEKEVLKAYDKYLAYFLNNDMDSINSLVKFPTTYIAVENLNHLMHSQLNQKK